MFIMYKVVLVVGNGKNLMRTHSEGTGTCYICHQGIWVCSGGKHMFKMYNIIPMVGHGESLMRAHSWGRLLGN